MARSSKALLPLGVAVLIVAVFYHQWFQPGVITAGDWPYVSADGLSDMAPFPSLWNSALSTGAYNILAGPMFPLQALQGIMSQVRIDWATSERIVWVYPTVLIPCVSTYTLSLSLFRRHMAAFISALAIVMNSYAYLIYEGGQFTVAMGYGFMPLVLWSFVRGQRSGNVNNFVLTGTLMAVQAMYDIRSTYITIGVLLVYGLFCCRVRAIRGHGVPAFRFLALPGSLGLLHLAVALVVLTIVHLWWILPALFVRIPALPAGYTDVAGVHLLSTMQLSNGLSLFHPFWFANNLRTYPINPLFFLVPLLIFGLLLRRQYNQHIIFLSTIALIAAFLVKGDNDPAGGVYDWLFVHLPGFSFFREASKFFQPLALAYALLLGAAVAQCWRRLSTSRSVTWRGARMLLAGMCVWLAVFPAYPALLRQAGGALAARALPTDYARFNDLIDSQHDFFRVLWVPARPRFGTFSSLHPALDVTTVGACCVKIVSPTERLWSWLYRTSALQVLNALSVHYIVVPDESAQDTIGQSYLAGGAAVSPSAFLSAVRTFLPTLHEVTIGRLHVFVIPVGYPLLYTVPDDRHPRLSARCTLFALCLGTSDTVRRVRLAYQPTHDAIEAYTAGQDWYDIRIRVMREPVYLVFQQSYDPNWVAFVERDTMPVSHLAVVFGKPLPRTDHILANGYANAWTLRAHGTYHVVLEYWPQRLVLVGWFFALLVFLLYVGVVSTQHLWRHRMLSLRSSPLHSTLQNRSTS